ncbi:hypothetical protein [Candidatus Lokiarchaeum ossiferum]|uniref:hypothetical protein n=1 Tax=Candidatus Lokiarchaeum ossiferum TaxID=2951803 RepID=UPI00352D2B3E
MLINVISKPLKLKDTTKKVKMPDHGILRDEELKISNFWHTPEFLLSIIPYLIGLVLIYIEGWTSPQLFLFPIITWFGTIFFCILWIFKVSTQPRTDCVFINPLSSEKLLWYIFLVSSLSQIIILLILGLDAKIHPQLMDNYAHFFILPVILIYCLTWFWVIWFSISGSSTKIQHQIMLDNSDHAQSKAPDIIIATFSIKNRKRYEMILIIGWFIILAITVIDSLFIFLTAGLRGLWRVNISFPVDNDAEVLQVYFSGLIYIVMGLFPFLASTIEWLIIKKFKTYYKNIVKQLERNQTMLNSSEKATIIHGLKSFKI